MDEAANSTAIPIAVDPFGDSYEAVLAYVRNVLTSHGTNQLLQIRSHRPLATARTLCLKLKTNVPVPSTFTVVDNRTVLAASALNKKYLAPGLMKLLSSNMGGKDGLQSPRANKLVAR